MNISKEQIEDDIARVSQNTIVPSLLEVICRTTGMGFAAIARVTPEQWIACGVRDEINFGLRVGGELKVDTTICHEIRQSGSEVVIDCVANDEFYRAHHTPLMYGFQSYISVPIKLRNELFFGTLCAIDPSPAILNTPEIVGMFKTYAALISLHINATNLLPDEKLKELQAMTDIVIKKELIVLQNSGALPVAMHTVHAAEMPKRNKNFAHAVSQSSERIKDLMVQLNTFL